LFVIQSIAALSNHFEICLFVINCNQSFRGKDFVGDSVGVVLGFVGVVELWLLYDAGFLL
jgi:hypothetical protein